MAVPKWTDSATGQSNDRPLVQQLATAIENTPWPALGPDPKNVNDQARSKTPLGAPPTAPPEAFSQQAAKNRIGFRFPLDLSPTPRYAESAPIISPSTKFQPIGRPINPLSCRPFIEPPAGSRIERVEDFLIAATTDQQRQNEDQGHSAE